MSTTAWILLVLAIVYVPIWFYAWRSGKDSKWGLEKYGPTIKINTRFGIRLMDRLCVYHRFWRCFGVYSQIVTFGLMAMMVYMMVVSVINLPNALSNGGMGIEYALAIPGLNPIMPFWYTLLALIVGLVLHELAHGMQTRTNGMRVKHTGLLYAVVPIGAFVEPEEEDVRKAPRRVRLDLYAAGVATNFTIAAVAFLLMSGMMAGLDSPYDGNAAVYQEVEDSPADVAGIPAGAIILTVDGQRYLYDSEGTYVEGADGGPGWRPGKTVTVAYDTEHDKGVTTSLLWGVYVSDTADDGPARAAGISKGATIAYVVGADGEKTYMYTASGFSSYMKGTSAGDTVTVGYVTSAGAERERAVTLTDSPNGDYGYLGVYTTTAGMNLISPEALLETGRDPLYGYDSVMEYGVGFLHYISLPFAGFAPVPESVEWWFGDQFTGFWTIAHVLYWMFWLNILLGITNALPAVPFDGGYVFAGWVDALLERTGKKDQEERKRATAEITRNVSTLFLFMFALVVIAAIVRNPCANR